MEDQEECPGCGELFLISELQEHFEHTHPDYLQIKEEDLNARRA